MGTTLRFSDATTHNCPVAKAAGIPCEFRISRLEHKYEGESVTEDAIALGIPTPMGVPAFVQVDFCPFCGEQVSTSLRYGYKKPDRRREESITSHTDYFAYRQRYNKTVRQRSFTDGPLSENCWREFEAELAEINLLLPYARAEFASSLFQRKQILNFWLCYPDLRERVGRLEVAKEMVSEPTGQEGWFS